MRRLRRAVKRYRATYGACARAVQITRLATRESTMPSYIYQSLKYSARADNSDVTYARAADFVAPRTAVPPRFKKEAHSVFLWLASLSHPGSTHKGFTAAAC